MENDVLKNYDFDDIADMKRRPEIEAKGTVVGFPGGDGKRWMRIAAATSNNPYWRAQQDRIRAQLKAFNLARAPEEDIREYLAAKYAELLIRDWGGWTIQGNEIPFSKEAATALLIKVDDVYKIVNGLVFEDENFRAEQVKAIIDEGKD